MPAADGRGAPLPTMLSARDVEEALPGLVTLVPDGRELAALRRDQGGHLPADLVTRAWCLRLLLDRLGTVAEAVAPR